MDACVSIDYSEMLYNCAWKVDSQKNCSECFSNRSKGGWKVNLLTRLPICRSCNRLREWKKQCCICLKTKPKSDLSQEPATMLDICHDCSKKSLNF